MCHTETMSPPSLSEHLALVAAEPALAGHPVVAGLVVAVDQLATELAALREENADLRRQLNRHSGNSGQPRRRARVAADGRGDGARGASRAMRAGPEIRWHRHRSMPMWTTGQRTAVTATRPCPGQLWAPRPGARCTTCRPRTRAAFPTAVAGPVQYGPRLPALVAYLRYAQHLPVARLARLLRELHGMTLATGTVANLCRRVAAWLAPEGARLRERALALPVACMDETSLRVAGGRAWLHVLCDAFLTCYRLGDRGDVWTAHVGVAVHDRFSAYGSRLPDETVHALCHSHLLRNLQEIVELEQAPEGWAATPLHTGATRPAARCRSRSGSRQRRPGMPS